MKIVNFCHFFENRPKIVKNPGGVKNENLENRKGQKSRRKRRLKNGFWPVDRGPPGVRDPKKGSREPVSKEMVFFGRFSDPPQKSSFFDPKKKTGFLTIFDDF